MTNQTPDTETHWGADPGHGGLTQHKGARENCTGPDCGDAPAEPAAGIDAAQLALYRGILRAPIDPAHAPLLAVASHLLAGYDAVLADRAQLRRQLDAAEAQPALRADLTRYIPVADDDGNLSLWCTDCSYPTSPSTTSPIWTEEDAAEQVTELSLANLVAITEEHEREHHGGAKADDPYADLTNYDVDPEWVRQCEEDDRIAETVYEPEHGEDAEP